MFPPPSPRTITKKKKMHNHWRNWKPWLCKILGDKQGALWSMWKLPKKKSTGMQIHYQWGLFEYLSSCLVGFCCMTKKLEQLSKVIIFVVYITESVNEMESDQVLLNFMHLVNHNIYNHYCDLQFWFVVFRQRRQRNRKSSAIQKSS